MSGKADGRPEIVVTDINSTHGRIHDAATPKVDGDIVTYNGGGDESKTASIASLMGFDVGSIYRVRSGQANYAQFLAEGRAVLSERNGEFRTGNWSTDGISMSVPFKDHPPVEILRSDLTPVDGVPAGSRLTVRLLQPLSSHKVKEGDKVEAVLISPASLSGKIFMPQGSTFAGRITKAHGVGWGIRHETAAVTVEFTSVKLPDGETLAVHARLEQVDNSQEKVNQEGAIEGIRSTGTLGHSAESKIASVAAVEPISYLFTTVTATAALGFAEPEILYPAGTELSIQIDTPLITSKVYPASVPVLASSQAEEDKLLQLVRSLPFRTTTKGSNKPSDLTNLAFMGSPSGLRNAFKAAGWVATDQLTANSTFETIRTLGGNQSYNEAPMSVLLLDERPPIFTLTKTTNTFVSRHHIRVFDPGLRYEGTAVLTASSTENIGIAFSRKQKTFIHVIDQHIDNERSKVVNDLEFTGCVQAAQFVPRPWTPQDAYNSTGDRLQTDGGIVVLRMNECVDPKRSPSDNAVRPDRFERIARDTVLTLKNDIWRGNVGYQGYSGVKAARSYWLQKDELKTDAGAWRKTDVSGATFKGVGNAPTQQQASARIRFDQDQVSTPDASVIAAERTHRWDPPRYEIGLEGGYLRYPNTKSEGAFILLVPKDLKTNPSSEVLGGAFADRAKGGWTAGIYFTANTWKWFSNEFSYSYQRGRYRLEIDDFNNANATSSQFTAEDVGLHYQAVRLQLTVQRATTDVQMAVVSGGRSLAAIAFPGGCAPEEGATALRFGLQNVGTLLAAFNFAGDPPLEGGGIFQVGLQYGAGIKYRVHPRITVSADFRETWSKNPHFITNSYTDDYFGSDDLNNYDIQRGNVGESSAFREDRFTLGAAFTF